jgi:DNA-binding response OmpR family regulator
MIDMENEYNYRDIRLAQSKVFSFIKNHPGLPYLYAPLIAIFEKEVSPTSIHDLRDLIADWALTNASPKEIANRIIFALTKKNVIKNTAQELDVVFSLPSKTISFKGESMQLSPTEYALAEIFFSRVNETIPLNDLVIFFQSIGSSTSMNNIRVVIFHLRMKLAQLTQNNWILSSIYRRGYVLRRARGNNLKTGNPTKIALENF